MGTYVTWKSSWTYRGVVGKTNDDINGSLWFQLCVMVCVLLVWVFAIVKSIKGNRNSEDVVSYLLNVNCNIARLTSGYEQKFNWFFYPRIIITRTTASLVVAVGTIELVIFNAIANYSGSGSTNASSAFLVLVVGFLFHFFIMTHKIMKSSDSDSMNKMYWVSSASVLLMAVGSFFGFLSYTDTMRWKDENGKSIVLFVGAVLIVVAALIMCVAPMTSALKPFHKREEGTVSLIMSGEYYTSLSVIDCFVVWATVSNFICMEGYLISHVSTQNYALPFVFLQTLPLYGFFTAIIGLTTKPNVLAVLFNAGLFFVMSVCITSSMLHVCAIPGVRTACVTSISHTVVNTNMLVCGPYLILLLMTSVGLINSSFTPSFLIRQDCITKTNRKQF